MFEREPIVGTMSAQVAKLLGMRIVSGEFRPGDALPIEEELCAAYGVSRTTIREAVKSLAGKRLIDVMPKIGTRVLPFTDWNLLDRDVLAWRLHAQFDRKIVEDIYEMRLCFEPRATALAARNGARRDHQVLERRYQELVLAYEMPGEIRLAAEADLEFHLAIIAMSGNGLFITIGNSIKAALRVSAEMLQRDAERLSEDLVLHEAVLKAVKARRAQAASRAMVSLLTASRDRVLAHTVKAAAPGVGS
ncbi:MAG TPA: FadR/GntR family transcriptional regulator [Myxococcaceae bacterium]|nr:FadR/GntR family transcriptional regulator [Myxococcaceae bacterium]